MNSMTIFGRELQAAVLDLDGVITRTASTHARAWKTMFDEYLHRRRGEAGERPAEFSIEDDYLKYVDGKPRYDGVEAFLQSRGIELPWGEPGDEPGKETVCGLGNRKNVIFLRLLEEGGVEVFDDAVRAVRAWRQRGAKTALVSSSKNCNRIVEAAKIGDLFDATVEGGEAQRERLPGKPQPDTFLRAAEKLGVGPEAAAVFEDAVAGVEAGRRGGFALVVGVARRGGEQRLRQGGADVVIASFDDIPENAAGRGGQSHFRGERRFSTTPTGSPAKIGTVPHDAPRPIAPARRPPSALECFNRLRDQFAGKRPALFLDYDGTLTPIVARPEDAVMGASMRRAVRRLAELIPVAIISGRDRADVEALVDLPELVYAGSHGFDIRGPDLRREHEGGRAALPDLDAAEEALRRELASIEGAHVERKRFAVAIHYRNVAEERAESVRGAVERVARPHPKLRMRGGKKIFELQPDIDWHKGKAVLWLMEVLGMDPERVVPMYLGDDVTDEDAFAALEGRGVGVVVGDDTLPSRAGYWLADPDEVQPFLETLIPLLEGSDT